MITAMILIWYVSSFYLVIANCDTKAEQVAVCIIGFLGPFVFPILIASHLYREEREKWQRNAWYRDNWPPKEYTIIGDGDAS